VKKYLTFAASVFAVSIAMGAEPRQPAEPSAPASVPVSDSVLTLKKAFELASLRSERLDIQSERIEQSRARYRQTRGAALPDLRFNVEHRIQDKPPETNDGNSADRAQERTESKFTLRQPIFQGFKEFAALSSLRADERKQALLFQREAALLYLDVAAAFFDVIELETELTDLRLLMGLSKERIDDLLGRNRLGKSRTSEVVTAESQYANYRAREAGLVGDVAAARERLSFFIAEPLGLRPLVDNFPDPQQPPLLDDMVSRAKDRSDVAALREEIEARRNGLRVASASSWPSIWASGNYYLKRPEGFQEEIDWDALFELDVPLYRGGAGRALRQEARSLIRQAEKDYARLLRFTESDVRRSHAFLASSIEESRLLDDAVRRGRRAYELLVKEYRMGLANNLDVLQAMNTYQTIKRDHDLSRLQAKLDLIILRLAVEMSPDDLP